MRGRTPSRPGPAKALRRAARRAMVFAVLLAVPAHSPAEETYPSRQFGWWEVYGWNKDCWMKGTYEGGTELLFSWDFDSPKLFVLLRNSKWASIVEGRKYRVRIVIDGWGIYEDATGRTHEGSNPGISLFIDPSQEDMFLARLYSGRSIDLYVGDKSAGSYSLKDSGAAVRELVTCARALQPSADEDPFSLSI